jgi:tRNA-dihydrouridine synthase A
MKKLDRRLSIAPMMDHTDRHFRYLMRLITRRTLLYTEMVTTGALLHGPRDDLLAFSTEEHPIALQLGGSQPDKLAECAGLAEDRGYDEVNLNVGCPSDRVQNGRFGACLMAEPELVAECVKRMTQEISIPVTVKTRIGIDDRDRYEHLCQFIEIVRAAGCNTFIIHARKAWLSGLSPKQNREIPPLQYQTVHQLKQDFPDLEIVVNGGFTNLEQVGSQLAMVDGVMIGRGVVHNPYLLAEADRQIFGVRSAVPSREAILEHYLRYIEQQLVQGARLQAMTRHVLGLYLGQYGARKFRRILTENARKTGSGRAVLTQALAAVQAAPQI